MNQKKQLKKIGHKNKETNIIEKQLYIKNLQKKEKNVQLSQPNLMKVQRKNQVHIETYQVGFQQNLIRTIEKPMEEWLNFQKQGEKLQHKEKKMKQTEAIILSMTLQERSNPSILNAKRRLRIANGSGTKVSSVNSLIRDFEKMRKVMKMFKGNSRLLNKFKK